MAGVPTSLTAWVTCATARSCPSCLTSHSRSSTLPPPSSHSRTSPLSSRCRNAILARYEVANYWGNFVNSGNPNTPLAVAPYWDAYNRTTDLTNVFLTGVSTPGTVEVTALQGSTCDFWDSIGYQY